MLGLMCLAVSAGTASTSAQAPRQPPEATSPPLEPDGVVAPGGDPLGGLRQPGDEVRLSNERTLTRWATAFRRSVIRTKPLAGAPEITRLRFASASRAAEIYGVLRGRLDGRGQRWLQVRVPGRPNGRVGWALADAFGPLHIARTQLVVNRKTVRATLYRRGRKVWRGPVGVGKASTPTPGGHYFIDRKEGAIYGPAYGPRVLFTSAFTRLADWPGGGIVGMHGTNEPGLVPGRPSHGCIRLHNRDIRRLARLARVGTPLLIR